MLFIDEETRHDYYQSPALLQVICQIFEHALAEHGIQVEAFDWMLNDEGHYEVVLHVLEVNFDAIEHACVQVNRQFLRLDKRLTAEPIDKELGFVRIYFARSSDFEQVH